MLILLSPAKSLDFVTKINYPESSVPEFLPKTYELILAMQKLSVSELEKLFDVSKKLAELNFERFQNFSKKHDFLNSKPAILAFDGDVYSKIDKKSYDFKDFEFAEQHLRILSGLYGLLRPLDLIQPYRLEMGTDFKDYKFGFRNLYEFWHDSLSEKLDSIEQKHVINLASEEYFSVINPKKIRAKIINVIFKENKNGALKIIGINAKKARGSMANFAIKNRITDPEKLKKFDLENYKFNQKLSNPNNFIFTR